MHHSMEMGEESVGARVAATSDAPAAAHVISGAGLTALRSAVQAQLRGERPESALQRAIQLLCAEAHRSGLRVEQLLVTLKQAWASLPEVERLLPTPRATVREHLIAMCIEEFYAVSEPAECPPEDSRPTGAS